MVILGIETSCDDTCAAIIEARKGKIKILSNVVSSQIKLHAPYGGVVPMLASRAHLENIIPVLSKAIKKSKKSFKDIDFIAVTRGPGLIPALVVGVNAAKALAYVWKKRIVGVNHIEAHIIANLLPQVSSESKVKSQKSKIQIKNKKIEFPVICLIISGGHTQLILMKDFGKYKILGETCDDAVGEAFDKVARILGLSYPGGPAIAEQARQWKSQILNSKSRINSKFKIRSVAKAPSSAVALLRRRALERRRQSSKFIINLPRPMIDSKDYDFSFSGLKTAVLYSVKNLTKKYSLEDIRPAVSFEFQEAVTEVLCSKAVKAIEKYQVKTLMLGGGVAANNRLRLELKKEAKKLKVNFLYPPKKFCLDNGAMVALAGYYHWIEGDFKDWRNIKAEADLRL